MGVVQTLSRLVGYPTVSNRPLTALAADLAAAHEAWGFRVERFEASDLDGKVNVVASARPVLLSNSSKAATKPTGSAARRAKRPSPKSWPKAYG